MGLGASSRLKHREVAKGSYKNCKQRTSWFHPVQVQSARSHLQEVVSGGRRLAYIATARLQRCDLEGAQQALQEIDAMPSLAEATGDLWASPERRLRFCESCNVAGFLEVYVQTRAFQRFLETGQLLPEVPKAWRTEIPEYDNECFLMGLIAALREMERYAVNRGQALDLRSVEICLRLGQSVEEVRGPTVDLGPGGWLKLIGIIQNRRFQATFNSMADEKAKVMAESGSSLGMEPKVQKMMELNSLREKLSEKFCEDNKGSVTFFGVTMDPNDCPAIQIGVPPEVDQNSLTIPEELAAVNVVFSTMGWPTHGGRLGSALKIPTECDLTDE
eukprot:symbB.v1.2.015701.t1/scaffold1180.1/size133432/10